MKSDLKIGIISDGKYGERAYANIKKRFETKWILLPEISSNVMLDDEIDLDIPECDLYISYVRHPDVILQLAELQKPLILGVLPGVGLLQQAKSVNPDVVHAPTMCSLENNTGIPEIDNFITFFGRPVYELNLDKDHVFKRLDVKRSSLCGSSEAGSKFLLNKVFNQESLQNFALSICHECRAPRFGHTCDKEVAGIIHLNSLLNSIPQEIIDNLDGQTKLFIKNIEKEYISRLNNSRKILNQVN
ncbi:MAG: DUF166 family protein [Promethearchaeota archaeon]